MEDLEPPFKRRRLSDNQAQENVPVADSEPEKATIGAIAQDDNASNGKISNDVEAATTTNPGLTTSSSTPQLSKNQLKKLRKKEEWEAGREERKLIRKEKNQAKKTRKREQRQEERETRLAQGLDPLPDRLASYKRPIRLPVAILIDCGFDDKMSENERISLGSQLTRSYSDNSKAPFQAHFYISSWDGMLKQRFDTILHKHHQNWKGVKFTSESFVEAARMADTAMKSSRQDKFSGVFAKYGLDGKGNLGAESKDDTVHKNGTGTETENPNESGEPPSENPSAHMLPPVIEDLRKQGEVVYLTSDSPYTLTELKPYSTYIVGGLVDKNRHKGICYKLACDHGVKTAKLPIGQYMRMQSRYVLATNHVVEIMVRWLECGDWGEAFMKVIPKRKGGELKEGDRNNGVEIDLEQEAEPESEQEADTDADQEGGLDQDERNRRQENMIADGVPIDGKSTSTAIDQDQVDPVNHDDNEA